MTSPTPTPRAAEALAARQARPGWECIITPGDRGISAHHYPVGDIERHQPSGTCPCKPRVDRGGTAVTVAGETVGLRRVVWHNAWDGRDLVAMCEEGVL